MAANLAAASVSSACGIASSSSSASALFFRALGAAFFGAGMTSASSSAAALAKFPLMEKQRRRASRATSSSSPLGASLGASSAACMSSACSGEPSSFFASSETGRSSPSWSQKLTIKVTTCSARWKSRRWTWLLASFIKSASWCWRPSSFLSTGPLLALPEPTLCVWASPVSEAVALLPSASALGTGRFFTADGDAPGRPRLLSAGALLSSMSLGSELFSAAGGRPRFFPIAGAAEEERPAVAPSAASFALRALATAADTARKAGPRRLFAAGLSSPASSLGADSPPLGAGFWAAMGVAAVLDEAASVWSSALRPARRGPLRGAAPFCGVTLSPEADEVRALPLASLVGVMLFV
mmetsp:Transcript_115302/g.288083  ORF Transcript_115302/g.288083 Transcript_115302/m.288083 type:complete len:354 (-) Transcript_115302:738-1799(-)